MSRVFHVYTKPFERLKLSLFEKVILANSVMLIFMALVGLWITSHNLEAHHYLIDTSFIVLATLLGLLVNVALIRASFRPLFGLMRTIRKVSAGNTHTRAQITATDTEIGELAQAFNSMLDRLEQARREQAMLILQAQEEERRRLALELHDESSQNLSALLIHTEILCQSLQAIPDQITTQPVYQQLCEGLQVLNRLTQKTLDNIRTLAQQLRPSVLDDLGLYSALRWLAEDSRERLQLPVEVHLEHVGDTIRTQKQAAIYETTLFRIAQGGAFLYPGLAKALIRSYVASPASASPASNDHQRMNASSLAQALRILTPREVEVLRLVAEGRTNQEIADQLTLSIKTVQTHRANVMEKLELRDITHLVRFAIRHSLIPSEP